MTCRKADALSETAECLLAVYLKTLLLTQDYLASNDWTTQNNEVEKILEGSSRGLLGDAVLSFGWMTQANYEQDGQRTGDGQNNGNT